MDVLYQTLLEQLGRGGSGGYVGLWLFAGSLVLGAAHTLGPGHGKSLLLGVLVAESRRPWHAVKMALVIGLTHMADVVVLSLLSIFVVSFLPPGSISPLLSLTSGAGVLVIGLLRLRSAASGSKGHSSEGDGDAGSPDSEHDHHTRDRRNLLTAFLYSLAPCPGAWVLFMACLGLGKPLLGVVMLIGFTGGLLMTIVGMALTMVYSFSWLGDRLPAGIGRVGRVVSGGVVVLLGGWMMVDGGSHAHLGETGGG